MNARFTRRHLLKNTASAVGIATLVGPGNSRVVLGQSEAPLADAGEWSFSLLGDLHFDRLDHHDFDWVKREQPNAVNAIESYSRITESNLPTLIQRVKDTVQTTGCHSVVQIGDLVQGLCGNEQLARRHCKEAIDFIDQAGFGVPVRMTKGNHDITGPGAIEAYNEVMVPWIDRGLGISGGGEAHFEHRKGDDLFVYFDAYNARSLDWFAALMASRRPDSTGRVFFIVHPPVVPYNARSSWCLFGRGDLQEKRELLYEILGRHHAIVLCGHLHKYSLVERKTGEGHFTQLSISSVAYNLKGKARDLISGVDQYGPNLVDLEPGHSPDTVSERRAILEREKPFIRRFDYGNFWGHAVVRLSPLKVEADIFQHLGEQPWKTVRLS
ncbi:MAG: metallophosphoesterase [Verrucomicrobiales bacterium]|nr:metallophosphoesterase [Verrucomicrobiales bacterium]